MWPWAIITFYINVARRCTLCIRKRWWQSEVNPQLIIESVYLVRHFRLRVPVQHEHAWPTYVAVMSKVDWHQAPIQQH